MCFSPDDALFLPAVLVSFLLASYFCVCCCSEMKVKVFVSKRSLFYHFFFAAI